MFDKVILCEELYHLLFFFSYWAYTLSRTEAASKFEIPKRFPDGVLGQISGVIVGLLYILLLSFSMQLQMTYLQKKHLSFLQILKKAFLREIAVRRMLLVFIEEFLVERTCKTCWDSLGAFTERFCIGILGKVSGGAISLRISYQAFIEKCQKDFFKDFSIQQLSLAFLRGFPQDCLQEFFQESSMISTDIFQKI